MKTGYYCKDQQFKVKFDNFIYFAGPQADWKQEDSDEPDFIKNKPKTIEDKDIILILDCN